MRENGLVLISLVSIPLEQGSVFRHNMVAICLHFSLSQSLWNRAVSSDLDLVQRQLEEEVSIPLEQGSVFRRIKADGYSRSLSRLNPFGTGQCLPTAVVF